MKNVLKNKRFWFLQSIAIILICSIMAVFCQGCDNMANKKIKFSVFADMHYKYMMYASTIEDLDAILKRADDNKVDFVIHCGDFCNDYMGSPELWNTYLNNKYGLPVHGIYGNHELEALNNSMEFVTPRLTNARDNVWGTEDGKIGDGNIAYYYFDMNGFRMICTDTNYSYNYETSDWEHNRTCSYGPPNGNGAGNSLGPKQLEWLEKVLDDAAEKDLKCIVFSHDSFSGVWGSSPDTEKVQEMFTKVNYEKPGTVLMAINGHYHRNRMAEKNNIVYLDVNTVKNGEWIPNGYEHYGEEHTFEVTEYDDEGNALSKRKESLGKVGMGKNSWFFEDPLNAIITVEDNGHIVIDGMKSDWCYNILPDRNGVDGCVPEITSKEFNLDIKKNYKLVWSEDFKGNSLNSDIWHFSERMHGTRDMTLLKTEDVAKVEDDMLKLRAIKYSDPKNPDVKYAVTYSVTTKRNMSFKYGKVEMRARVPYKKGCWPSLWMLSDGAIGADDIEGYTTEIDIFEVFASHNALAANIHKWYKGGGSTSYDGRKDENGNQIKKWHVIEDSVNLSNEFHIYGMEWTPDKISMSIDGYTYITFDLNKNIDADGKRTNMNAFHDPCFLILNNHLFSPDMQAELGFGAVVDDSLLPMEYDIDWIKLYQIPGMGEFNMRQSN